MSAIDETFRGFVEKLPEAATLSEQNGFTIPCGGGRSATLTLLHATAKKVKIERDDDLVSVAFWARHGDACIRQIALQVILPRIGYDSNRLAVPSMHDPEHHEYHDIFVALKADLDRKHVAYDAKLFDGMMVDVTPADFGALVHGTWIEEIENKNFQEFLEVDREESRVTSRRLPPDPNAPDYTQTTKIKDVTTTERGQFVLTGAWSVESSSAGYEGPKNEPAQFVYSFWPVKPGVMWFKNGETAYWIKMKKAG